MKCPICDVLEVYEDDALACQDCVMTGRQMEFWLTEPIRSDVLGRIRDLPNVVVANLWPSGPKQWLLAVYLDDGRFVTPMALLNTDPFTTAALIPMKDQPWVPIVSTRDDNGQWNPPEVIEEGLTDDELVDFIAQLGE